MMAAKKSKQSKVNGAWPSVGLALLCLCACAGAPSAGEKPQAQVAVPTVATAGMPKAVEDPNALNLEMSKTEAANGGLVLLTVRVPKSLNAEMLEKKELSLTGQTSSKSANTDAPDGVKLLFYPVKEMGEGVYEAVVPVSYHQKPGVIEVHVKISKGSEIVLSAMQLLTVVDGKYDSETLKVDPNKVHPSKKDLERIHKEIQEVGKIYSHVIPEKYWKGAFKFPMKSSLTSSYGTKRMFNGEFQSFHSGQDFKAAIGTKVFASAPGEVVLAKDLFFSGKTVLINHGYGVFTMYAHLSRFKVKVGQKVKTGALVGLSGKTGRVTGPHLHWQAIVQKQKINPMDLTRILR